MESREKITTFKYGYKIFSLVFVEALVVWGFVIVNVPRGCGCGSLLPGRFCPIRCLYLHAVHNFRTGSR